ncbi:hypothetical protein J7U46_17655 [Pelomonas sp. V22]|uniref:hypothetical protein n=1 Tax=Pelomonas sp. V22 TaxID=2822139 RepID=UPI0024A7E061|nr:hypothetical protein [Pelomonas sp. V22]MDI4634891.1 hypothetical protein [Pelomonas sp. V22]
MFEKAVLQGASRSGGLTIGQIAEALLFYQSVHLILDAGAVMALAQSIGCGGLIDLLKREGVTATFVEGMPVTYSQKMGALTAHTFEFMALVPKRLPDGFLRGRRQLKLASLAGRLLDQGFSKPDTRRLVQALADIPHKVLGDENFGKELPRLALNDLKDDAYCTQAIRDVLGRLVPPQLIPQDFRIRIQESDLGFYLFGDLRVHDIEAARLKLALPGEPVTEALVIGNVHQARVDMYQGAHYGGDFYTSPDSSSLIKLRCESLLVRAGLHQEEKAVFEDVVLDGCPSVAEVIDAGERSFSEFAKLLDKAGSFRKWVHSVNPDRQLVSAYLEEVSRQGWLQTSKGKSLRYVLGLATGLGEILGPIFGAFDAFGIDAIADRWRASHFVDQRLKPFLDK